MYQLHGRDFIEIFLGVHNVLRATVSEHPKYDVWYYYVVIFLAGFFPWSLVFIPGKIRDWLQHRPHLPREARERFLLVWAVTVFVLFQCFATKYATYTLPYMIPVAIFMACWFQKRRKLFSRMAWVMVYAYIALLFQVAAPLMQEHSVAALAAGMQPYLAKGAELYCYDVDESASLAYYTGHFPQELVSKEQAEGQDTHKMDWKVKDVIPAIGADIAQPVNSRCRERQDQPSAHATHLSVSLILLPHKARPFLANDSIGDKAAFFQSSLRRFTTASIRHICRKSFL